MSGDLHTGRGFDAVFRTDLAVIGLCFSGEYLTRIAYPGNVPLRPAVSVRAKKARKMIEQLLLSVDEVIVDVPCKLDVTPFQERVLRELRCIPRGEVRTYGEIARRLNTSARAVGNACRRNPLPLVIPCHRVVSASGIGGYDGARDGRLLEIKRRLLTREGACIRE